MTMTTATADPLAADLATKVLRIVVHGAPRAGKTTTARALGERLGQPVTTPEEDAEGHTLLFDWMEYVGGRFDGKPIRTQLVTVPGHNPIRSRHLLRRADVVLFVVDTTARGIDRSVALLEDVRAQLATLESPPGLVVQANKRDESTAIPSAEVRRRVGACVDDVLIETVASDGDGVRQAFVYAVREGLRHLAATRGVAEPIDPGLLEAELRALDHALAGDPGAAVAAEGTDDLDAASRDEGVLGDPVWLPPIGHEYAGATQPTGAHSPVCQPFPRAEEPTADEPDNDQPMDEEPVEVTWLARLRGMLGYRQRRGPFEADRGRARRRPTDRRGDR